MHAPGAVLLDAGRPTAQRGRYDLISAWPIVELVPTPDEPANAFLQRLRQSLNALGEAQAPVATPLPFVGGLIGYLSYDFGRRLEQLPSHALDDLDLADARFGLYGWALITDHQQQRSQLVFHPSLAVAERQRLSALFASPPALTQQSFQLQKAFQSNMTEAQYLQGFAKIQAYIQAGDCYQVNFAQRFQAPYQGSPWTAYQALRRACPTPFAGYQALPNGGAIISLSPERFLRVSQGQVETRPIKGTRPRHADPQQDQAQADALLSSTKDRAENLMIVDLLRNDLGRSCKIGSVRVPELFALESYPNVHHLVSAVTGELAADKDALDLIAGSFPGGSITGAPKRRAMEIIEELERGERGLYTGCIGYFSLNGNADFNIAIRTIVKQGEQLSIGVGGGITWESEAAEEYQETLDKAKALLQVI